MICPAQVSNPSGIFLRAIPHNIPHNSPQYENTYAQLFHTVADNSTQPNSNLNPYTPVPPKIHLESHKIKSPAEHFTSLTSSLKSLYLT